MATMRQAPMGFMVAVCFAALAGCGSDDSGSTTGGAATSGVATSGATTSGTTTSSATVSGVTASGATTSQVTQPSNSVTGVITPSTSVTVEAAPTITGTPVTTLVAGTAYSFIPTTSAPSGATLAFTIKNMPSWAKFDATSGTLSGVPTTGNVGSYPNIVISAGDGSTTASLTAFAISVTAPVAAPTLDVTGTPASKVSVGAPYSFKPAADDSAGAKLKYSIVNKPTWATFNAGTGALTGTPGTANVGVTSQIVIRVTDGTLTASLPAFSITVASAPADSVALSWTEPTLNADGTPATNLSGYHIYYGTSAASLNNVVTVANAADTKEVVSNLAAGTWYFAVASYNTANVDSALTAVVSVSL